MLKDPAMRQASTFLEVRTSGSALVEVTADVAAWVERQGMTEGLLTVFCRHTSASLLIQENAASAVRADLTEFFAQLVPEEVGRYRHDEEGPDDMPSHIRAALTGVQLSIPLISGRLALGTWQGVFVFEHRHAPHRRELALHLAGA